MNTERKARTKSLFAAVTLLPFVFANRAWSSHDLKDR